jgi:hypothetical protein
MNTMKRILSLALLTVLPLTAFAKDEISKIAGTYRGETRAKGETRDQSNEGMYVTRHRTMMVVLGNDGTATLAQSPDAMSEITSFAHWTLQGDTIRLTFDPVDKQLTPAPMTFRYDHKTLTAIAYNHDLWRTLPPPPLKRQ